MVEPVRWSDEVDELLDGDLTAALAYNLPAGGTVLATVAPAGARDRAAGTVTASTSLGFGRKLERIAKDPRVALAYHARRFGFTDRPGLVVVQGTASISEIPPARWADLTAGAERHLGKLARGRFWDWWLQAYYRDRVLVDVDVTRVLAWWDPAAGGEPEVIGVPLPDEPAPPQEPPRSPGRADAGRFARAVGALPHRLVGFQGSDGFPVVLPVTSVAAGPGDALDIGVPATPLLTPGGRRAGLLGHRYNRQLVGLATRHAVGWLDVDAGGGTRFTPRITSGFTAPANKTALLLANGVLARKGLRDARRAGRGWVLEGSRGGGREEKAPG
jgi:hypothetical protein